MPHNKRLLRSCPQYAKKWANKLIGAKAEAARSLAGRGSLPVVLGLVDSRNVAFIRDKTEFLYVDHGYFCVNRAWDRVRIVRNGHHLSSVLDRPDDRLRKWDVRIDPWRRPGSAIVVIPPSMYYEEIYGLRTWLRDTLEHLARSTDRPVLVKTHKGGLEQFLQESNAHAVVCAMSVAGVEAALWGYPVFSAPRCASWPVSAGTFKNIDRPELKDRYAWACSLAYATWGMDELDAVDWNDYNYRTKDNDASGDNGP